MILSQYQAALFVFNTKDSVLAQLARDDFYFPHPTPRESFTMFCLAWYILALGFMVILPPQPSKSWDYKLEPHKLFLRFLLNYVYLYVSVCGYVYVSAGAQRSEEDVRAP